MPVEDDSSRPVTEDLADILAGLHDADDDRDASASIGARIMEVALRDREEEREAQLVLEAKPRA